MTETKGQVSLVLDLVMAGDPTGAAELLLLLRDVEPILRDDFRQAAKARWPYLVEEDLECWADAVGHTNVTETLYFIGSAAWETGELEIALSSFEAGARDGDERNALAFGEAQLWMNNISAAEPVLGTIIERGQIVPMRPPDY